MRLNEIPCSRRRQGHNQIRIDCASLATTQLRCHVVDRCAEDPHYREHGEDGRLHHDHSFDVPHRGHWDLIAEGLTRDGIPSPSAHDPERNEHRSGIAWNKFAVRAILINPRYTGHQVWNKQRRDEVLSDVEDVGLGHTTKLRWNDTGKWLWSENIVRPPIIDPYVFDQVQAMIAGRAHTPAEHKPHCSRHLYALRGCVWCGLCERRMQSHWAHDVPYYRCRFPAEYALANRVQHPVNVYLREDQLIGEVNGWLAREFAPHRLRATIADLAAAQLAEPAARPDNHDETALKIAECDRKLAGYGAALDAGASPATVVAWIADTEAEKAGYLAARRPSGARRRRMSEAEIKAIVDRLADLARVLADADPNNKSGIFRQLGLRLTYHPGRGIVEAQVMPAECGVFRKCPRGDLNPGTGEISLIADLNSKTGEKSPDRGPHAAMITGAPRIASSAGCVGRPRTRGHLVLPTGTTLAGGFAPPACRPWHPARHRGRCPGSRHGR
jgi:Recombinase